MVTLILKKKHNTAWNHSLCRISVVVQIVWNRHELVHLPGWWEAHPGRERRGSDGSSVSRDPGAGCLPAFIFSHTPGSQVLCVFCPMLGLLFWHRFLHCERLHCCLSSLCFFILKRTLRSVTYPFNFPHFPLWLLGGAWHKVDVHKYILNKWTYRWMNEQVNLTLIFYITFKKTA